MREVLQSLEKWHNENEDIAVATVISTWGSSPRQVGSKLILTKSGKIEGSVSAGCVEGAVIEEGLGVLESGSPRLLEYGVSDERAWEVNLACGGQIQVFVEPFSAWDEALSTLEKSIESREPVGMISVLEGPPELQNKKLIVLANGKMVGSDEILSADPDIQAVVLQKLENKTSSLLEFDSGLKLFLEVLSPTPRLIVMGGVHIAEALVTMASAAGFETVVIDPRRAFTTRERFPDVTSLIQKWPQEALGELDISKSDYIAVLTHDPKLDDPALTFALQSRASYVGALGSKTTNRKRIERLRASGLSEEQLARLHAPIGIDLGGRQVGEIAASILAEIVQVRNKKAS